MVPRPVRGRAIAGWVCVRGVGVDPLHGRASERGLPLTRRREASGERRAIRRGGLRDSRLGVLAEPKPRDNRVGERARDRHIAAGVQGG